MAQTFAHVRVAFLGLISNSVIRAAIVIAVLFVSGSSRAAQATFEYYGPQEGLTNLGGSCLVQTIGGYMLACTQQGVYSYDGRRFTNLGPGQGLRQGGVIQSIVTARSGDIAVAYFDAIYISDRKPDSLHPPSTLHFTQVTLPEAVYFERPHKLAAWRNGFVVLRGSEALYIADDPADPHRVRPLSYTADEVSRLGDVVRIFNVHDQLWGTTAHQICRADPGEISCFALGSASDDGPVLDLVDGGGAAIIARLKKSVLTIDPSTGSTASFSLPDQGGRYVNYRDQLSLFRSPDGQLMTQCDEGLAIRGPGGWTIRTVADGAPPGTIMSAISDAAGEFWFQTQGGGVVRSVGYGHWESLRHSDGISDGIPWMTVRSPDGRIWLSTDTGIDEVISSSASLKVGLVIPDGSYALAVGPDGRIWSSRGSDGLKVFDPRSGKTSEVAGPNVNDILAARDGSIWMATSAGLFHAAVTAIDGAFRSRVAGSPAALSIAVVPDGDGGVYYLSLDGVRHHHADGDDRRLRGDVPAPPFGALVLVPDGKGAFWLGGNGGLLHLAIDSDKVRVLKDVPLAEFIGRTVTAIMIDHRGWIWAGTALGISVYDGQRWVSADDSDGLLDDDISQDGIREDPDGTVWIANSRGLSHLSDPASLFDPHPIDVVISDALLGNRHLGGAPLSFSKDPLALQFGTTSYAAEHAILFRYRLDGVDAGWAETATGTVRYPFVPPGRHSLTVVAIDPLTHTVSQPAHLLIQMAFPWWRQWWSEALWLALAISTLYGLLRLRVRALTARQRDMQRRIDAATEEIRAAEVELRYRATHDGITALLNRTEVERRLADELASVPRRPGLMVALADLDHFKRVNDTFGHLAGDATLRSLGGLVERILRPGEYAGRYGGEEVLIVLDDTDATAAARIAELHEAVRGIRPGPPTAQHRITCSFGIAWERAGDTWETLIGRADTALYEAKQAGRDRIVESRFCRRETAAK